LYFTNSPLWLQWLYPRLTWHKNRREKFVYLTFDDGPVPVVTPFVINTLKNFNARATFFCIGDNVIKYPEIFESVLANGHRVGNHTHNHLKGWKTSTTEYLHNIRKCDELVRSNLFRPPYGRISRKQIFELNKSWPDFEIVMWDVLSGDFDVAIDHEKCISNVLRNARNGSIIVFHDSEKAFDRLGKALPVLLEELSSRGFGFKTL
jgi:peptidoglycan-N-acetylglucosamine deacetylase